MLKEVAIDLMSSLHLRALASTIIATIVCYSATKGIKCIGDMANEYHTAVFNRRARSNASNMRSLSVQI